MNRNRLLRLGTIFVCLYLIVTIAASMVDLWRAGDKFTSRQQKLAQLQAQQRDLLREKKKVESPDYLEKIARDDLGLSKPGEEILVIPPELLADHNSVAASGDATPNWEKWARLLL